MKLSVLIPVYNEKETILAVVRAVERARLPAGMTREIILVDDGSKDGTRELLRGLGKHTVVLHEANQGKGGAVRTAMKHATGDVMLIQDADLEYDPHDYYNLLVQIMEGRKVVYGTRYGRNMPKKGLFSFIVGNALLTFLTNMLYGAGLTDALTCYKVFLRDTVDGIAFKSRGFDFDPEITAKLLKRGYRIHEVPISYSPRNFAHGKKNSWWTGVVTAYVLLKYRFTD